MIEIIAGIIVLILAIIGIAKLAKWAGGGGSEGGGKAVQLDKKLLYRALEASYDAEESIALLAEHPEYFKAVDESVRNASGIASASYKNIQEHLKGVHESVSEYAKRINQRRALMIPHLARNFLSDAQADRVTPEQLKYRASEFEESMEHLKNAFGD